MDEDEGCYIEIGYREALALGSHAVLLPRFSLHSWLGG